MLRDQWPGPKQLAHWEKNGVGKPRVKIFVALHGTTCWIFLSQYLTWNWNVYVLDLPFNSNSMFAVQEICAGHSNTCVFVWYSGTGIVILARIGLNLCFEAMVSPAQTATLVCISTLQVLTAIKVLVVLAQLLAFASNWSAPKVCLWSSKYFPLNVNQYSGWKVFATGMLCKFGARKHIGRAAANCANWLANGFGQQQTERSSKSFTPCNANCWLKLSRPHEFAAYQFGVDHENVSNFTDYEFNIWRNNTTHHRQRTTHWPLVFPRTGWNMKNELKDLSNISAFLGRLPWQWPWFDLHSPKHIYFPVSDHLCILWTWPWW